MNINVIPPGAESAAPSSANVIERKTIEAIVAHRNKALELYSAAHAQMLRASEAIQIANAEAQKASHGLDKWNWHNQERKAKPSIKGQEIDDHETYMREMRKIVDVDCWSYIIALSSLSNRQCSGRRFQRRSQGGLCRLEDHQCLAKAAQHRGHRTRCPRWCASAPGIMPKQRRPTMTAITTSTLPVSDLRIDDKANVRKHGRGADPQMIASIKAIGLQQPLVVRPNGKGHVVIDGGKRFEAIAELVKAGDLPKDYAVPVIIGSADDAKARETSLALNVIRTNMHPVDEFRAFHQLHTDKTNPQTPEQIAARFGISTKGVVQRLALGALDDSVLNAWLAGEINADHAKLFTMQPSKKVQKAALEATRASNWGINSNVIRQALGLTRETQAGKLLALVTEDAYIARGGKVTRDLFASDRDDNTMISDPALLNAMAQELLDKECERLTAEGWGTVTQQVPDSIWNYPRIDVTAKPTKEEAARLKQIEKILREAEEISTLRAGRR